jgi:hypothetical protein
MATDTTEDIGTDTTKDTEPKNISENNQDSNNKE